MGLLATMYSTKIKYKKQVYGTILLSLILLVVGYGLISIFPFIIMVVLVQGANSILFVFSDVTIPTIIQNQFEKYQQSTVLSIFSMTIMGGISIGGVLEGILLKSMSVESSFIVMLLASCLLFISLFPAVYRFMKEQDPLEELHERSVLPPPIIPPPALF